MEQGKRANNLNPRLDTLYVIWGKFHKFCISTLASRKWG
jgi:hypothetical protein